jgi:hypothetical protein
MNLIFASQGVKFPLSSVVVQFVPLPSALQCRETAARRERNLQAAETLKLFERLEENDALPAPLLAAA